MEIVITEWALNSYLELKGKQVFNAEEYRKIIRPDVLLLKQYPHEIKFTQGKFWSQAQDQNGKKISDGYKMKWH